MTIGPINSADILIGQNIRTIKAIHELSWSQFASDIGYCQSVIYATASGRRRLSLPMAIAICKKCNVTLDWLYKPLLADA